MNLEKMKFWFCCCELFLWVSAPSARLSILPSRGMKFSLMTFSRAALGLAWKRLGSFNSEMAKTQSRN